MNENQRNWKRETNENQIFEEKKKQCERKKE